jgi:nitrite reductase/ring-hydroxylating ferredoxin subunit
MGGMVKVAEVTDLSTGEGKVVNASGKEIALFNVDGTFYAIGNTCVHRGGPLGEGELEGDVVTCNWHGWKYDVTSGVSPVNPAAKVPSYRVEVQGNDIFIELP